MAYPLVKSFLDLCESYSCHLPERLSGLRCNEQGGGRLAKVVINLTFGLDPESR
jgi:hypothetical protein